MSVVGHEPDAKPSKVLPITVPATAVILVGLARVGRDQRDRHYS
jgi:hypothetical protein